MGPDWWLKQAIEQLYQDGIRNLNLARMVRNLVVPSVKTLGLSLSVPYILYHGIAPHIISSPTILVTFQRRICTLHPLPWNCSPYNIISHHTCHISKTYLPPPSASHWHGCLFHRSSKTVQKSIGTYKK